MKPRILRTFLGTWVAGGLMAGWAWTAETNRPVSGGVSRPGAAARPATAARGVLPDPVLLDGSTHAAEKKSEFGMIGDFELPGDENARNGKVGGGGGQQQEQQTGAGGTPPMAGGGRPEAGKQGGGAAGEQTAQAGGGEQEPKGGEKPAGGAGDPNARPEGIQVAELGGDPSGGQPQGGPGQKPPPISIGDKAMRIPQQTPSVAVVGAQQLPNQNTQVYEKATGTGGKGPAGTQGPNRTEKGRSIPAGL